MIDTQHLQLEVEYSEYKCHEGSEYTVLCNVSGLRCLRTNTPMICHAVFGAWWFWTVWFNRIRDLSDVLKQAEQTYVVFSLYLAAEQSETIVIMLC